MEYIYLGNSGLLVPKYILGIIPFSGTNGFETAGNIKGKGHLATLLFMDALRFCFYYNDR